LTVCS